MTEQEHLVKKVKLLEGSRLAIEGDDHRLHWKVIGYDGDIANLVGYDPITGYSDKKLQVKFEVIIQNEK